eukprot:UN2882
MVMGDAFRAMWRVLKRLDFFAKDGVVLLKGRMACELTASDEVLMTEFFFQNVFAAMEANHFIAACSCLFFDENSEDPFPTNLELGKPFAPFKGFARSVGEVMVETKLPIDVEEYVGKVKPQFMAPFFSWLGGKRF